MPPTPPRRTKLRDVARLAGVSLGTASKALNGRLGVSPATRAAVLQAAESLSFEHSLTTGSLLRGRSGAVGLLTSDLEGRFSLPILLGAEDAFGDEEFAVLLSDARGEHLREQRHVRVLLSRGVDALMVVGSKNDPRPSLGVDVPVPVVYVYTPSEDAGDTSITPDNDGGGELAAQHLLSIGRTRIVHITGEPGESATVARASGIDRVLEGAGAHIDRTGYGEWTERWGRSAVLDLLRRDVAFDALICDSDQIARGAIDVLNATGRRVPDEVAVIGFDNWPLFSADANPPITSIDLGLKAMASSAARQLADTITRGLPLLPGLQQTPCRLVVRASTMPG